MASTVVFADALGAVLQYPRTLGVTLVEKQHGFRREEEKKRRKTKNKTPLNLGEKCQVEYHLQVRDRLLSTYTHLLEAGKKLNYFPVHQPSTVITSESELDFESLCSLGSSACGSTSTLELSDDCDKELIDVFGGVVSNSSTEENTINIMGRSFHIPHDCSFLLSDLTMIAPLYDHAVSTSLYDLIVIDPPWENRSAIRGKKYSWIPSERLLQIDIPMLAAEGAIVVVWVTNKKKIASYVQSTLFLKWNVEYITEWHWLKVTADGDLVHEMDSVHKKPYEIVIIGKYVGETPSPTILKAEVTDTCSLEQNIESKEDISCSMPSSKRLKVEAVDDKQVATADKVSSLSEQYSFVCVASCTHSQKPYLGDILEKQFTGCVHKLELFARNLHPHWTSWGNEVLKFQQMKRQ